MSSLVPKQANKDAKAVTLSLDQIYLVLIWFLVIIIVVTTQNHNRTLSNDRQAPIFGQPGGL